MSSIFKKFTIKYSRYYINWKNNQREYNHLKDLLKFAKIKQIINKKIVFNIVRCHKTQIDRELFIALLLSLHGAKCYVLLDDGILPLTEIYQVFSLPNLRDLKNNLHVYPYFHMLPKNYFHKIVNKIHLRKALKTYKNPNIKILYYSRIIDIQK